MKKLLMVITMSLAAALVAQDKTMSLADARGKIGDIISNPSTMTDVMKQLSASDQAAFLSDVNAAIDKMPGSVEEQTSKFVEVNSAALKGAQKDNLTTLLAEVFATVPPESLTAINEQFAAGMFNRSADPSKTYTDAQYKEISLALLDKVQERNATADNAGVRNTFVILMLIRGSNGSPADLRDTLVEALKNEETKTLAQKEWISPALGIGQEKTYEPMLGAAEAGKLPDPELVVIVPFSSASDALFADLASGVSLTDGSSSLMALTSPVASDANSIMSMDATDMNSASLSRLPRTMDSTKKYNSGSKRSEKPYEEPDFYTR